MQNYSKRKYYSFFCFDYHSSSIATTLKCLSVSKCILLITNHDLKYEKVHKFQTAKKSTPKHKTIRTTTEVLPRNDQE